MALPVAPSSVSAQSPGEGRGTAASKLDTIKVRAERQRDGSYLARRSRSSTRIDAPLRETPQSITVLSKAQIADQSMQSMADVVRYVPGVVMGLGEGHRDAPTIRGNSTTADFYVNGVRDDVQYLRDLYNVEQVEALKGANALAFGRGGGGGVINRVPREAQFMRVREATYTTGSFDQNRGTIDVGDTLSARAAVRVTGMVEHAGSYRSARPLDRFGINPTAVLALGHATTLRVGYEHFQDRRGLDRGVPSFGGLPVPVSERTVFGDASVNRSRVYVRSAHAIAEHGDAQSVHVRSQLRFTDYDKAYDNTVPGSISADRATYALSAYRNDTQRQNLFSQTDVTARRHSGAVQHTVQLGTEFGRQDTDNFRETGYFDGTSPALRVSLAAPSVRPALTFRQSASDADASARALIAAGYVQYQAVLGGVLQAIVGGRWDRFALDVDNHRTAERHSRTDVMFSPRIGVVATPLATLSAYASYSRASLPASGDQFSSLDATSETLAPERFVNREAGIKWDPRTSLAVTAAVFHLDRTNTRAPDPTTPGRVVQTGAQRTSGAEVGISGSVTSAWQVAGGWSLQRAEILRTTSSGRAGATVPLVPYQTLSLWNRLRLHQRVAVALGAVHQGRMYAAVDNAVTLPSFTRWDGALYVNLTRQLRLQANVENLLDVAYFPTAHNNNNIQPGAPRLLRVTFSATP